MRYGAAVWAKEDKKVCEPQTEIEQINGTEGGRRLEPPLDRTSTSAADVSFEAAGAQWRDFPRFTCLRSFSPPLLQRLWCTFARLYILDVSHNPLDVHWS